MVNTIVAKVLTALWKIFIFPSKAIIGIFMYDGLNGCPRAKQLVGILDPSVINVAVGALKWWPK